MAYIPTQRPKLRMPEGEALTAAGEIIASYGGIETFADISPRTCQRSDGILLASFVHLDEDSNGVFRLVVVDSLSSPHLRNMMYWAAQGHAFLRGAEQPVIDGFEAHIQRAISAIDRDQPQLWLPDFSGAIELHAPVMTEGAR